jgi:hypothetical protein
MTTFDLENPQPLAGDALRDEAANLLATKFGRPTREARVGGKKVDLLFTRRDFGKSTTLFVEAKDYGRRLQRSDVVTIWADYSGLIDKSAPATLLVITRQGLTADAEAFIDEQAGMRHQTIWELENEILGLTDYVRSLTGLFELDGLNEYYIAGRARAVAYDKDHRRLEAADVPLFEAITAWIETDDFQPIAILGGYGAGKSSFVKRLVAHQADRALSDPFARRPVLIGLGEYARYSSLEGLLGGKFTHDFPVDGFNVHHFLELSDKGRLVVVLDGFDEMKHAMSWGDFRAQIASLNRLTKGRAKVILSGRPSAFTSTEEHVHVLRGLKRYQEGFRRLPDWPEFREYDLEEFTRAERAQFVRGYLGFRSRRAGLDLGAAWIDARVEEVNRLADHDAAIFGKPVHAKILTDLAADPSVDLGLFTQGVSRWTLYEIFFNSLAEREVEKGARRPIGEAYRLDFLREVAFWLWSAKGGATAFSAHDLPDALMGAMAPGEAPDLDSLKREYLTGAFLEKKSGDIFYFGHRSFAEFLVAQRMVLKRPGPREQGIYSALVRDGVGEFLAEAPDTDAIRAWADELSTAQGVLHLEYFAFLAQAYGGVPQLIEALPSSSIWAPILSAFGPSLEWSPASWRGLIATLRTPNNALFFLTLQLLQLQAVADNVPAERLALEVAAALLDRVFETARVDETTGKAPIDTSHEEARGLASAVLPGLSNQFGDRALAVRGQRLAQLQTERLRLAGVEVTRQPPTAFRNLADEFALPWSDVLGQMSKANADKAAAYFRRNETLRGVFVRSVTPRATAGASSPNTGRRPGPGSLPRRTR